MSGAETGSRRLGLALPAGVLALTAWKAYGPMMIACRDDIYANGVPLALAVWLLPQAWIFHRDRGKEPSSISPLLLGGALLLCVAGSMSSLRILVNLALACAVPGFFRLGWSTAIPTLLFAPVWLPATGWFISKVKTGGLDGWERPLAALAGSLLVLAIHHRGLKPRPSTP